MKGNPKRFTYGSAFVNDETLRLVVIHFKKEGYHVEKDPMGEWVRILVDEGDPFNEAVYTALRKRKDAWIVRFAKEAFKGFEESPEFDPSIFRGDGTEIGGPVEYHYTRFGAEGSESFDSMAEAVSRALSDVEDNLAYPTKIVATEDHTVVWSNGKFEKQS